MNIVRFGDCVIPLNENFGSGSMKTMKKRILGFLSGIFLIVVSVQSGVAATYSSWILDLNGDGNTETGDQVSITEFLDINSPNLVLGQMKSGSRTNYTFSNTGITSITNVDSSGTMNDKMNLFSLTADYSFNGEGELRSKITFTPGGEFTLNVSGTPVARLTLIEGLGSVDEEGLPESNGQLTISYDLEVINSGYLLWDDGALMESAKVLTTTNASEIATPSTELESILLKAAFGIDPLDEDAKTAALSAYDFYYYLSSNGQFRLIREVPVPSAFLLLGSGIIGLVGLKRKNS